MLFDLANKLDFKRAISPVSVSDNTAQVSQIIDTKGYSADPPGDPSGTHAGARPAYPLARE